MTVNDIVLHVRAMEKNIVNHPQVEDVVVISIESPRGSYRLKAFVEPADDDSSTKNSIEKFCLDQSNALPMDVTFKEIPRTPSGKVARQQLLETAY